MAQDSNLQIQPGTKTKIVLVSLPIGGWEKFNAFHAEAQKKVPGITHDSIISAWVNEMLNAQPAPPPSTVEAPREKLEESNPS
ncbi:MAG TPA: hypothetical protein VHX90_01180 [Verrucomicrobiae bacterium]|jgi:hypothetical protein|nr:hypothetical protein [Verrucomicrobiae bacterium]